MSNKIKQLKENNNNVQNEILQIKMKNESIIKIVAFVIVIIIFLHII